MQIYYNDSSINRLVNIIEVGFQFLQYKGVVRIKVNSSRCFGYNVLNSIDFDELDDDITENPIDFEIIDEEEDDWFRMILKDDKGEEIIIVDELKDLTKYVVKVEIVDSELIKTGGR